MGWGLAGGRVAVGFGLGGLVLAEFEADYCLVLLLDDLLQIVDFPLQ